MLYLLGAYWLVSAEILMDVFMKVECIICLDQIFASFVYAIMVIQKDAKWYCAIHQVIANHFKWGTIVVSTFAWMIPLRIVAQILGFDWLQVVLQQHYHFRCYSFCYIGGNIGYMGGNSIGIEYPYEGNSNHYQLWKPPNGYFPRGEAPPPYEEAVAQSEALNTQCTVSVATTTHRSLPIGINPTDNSMNDSQANITTSTTNLINININSAGNLASENHQTQYSCNPALLNKPRSTQTHSNCSSSSSSSIGEPSNMLPRPPANALCNQPINSNTLPQTTPTATQVTVQSHLQPNSVQPVECTYKNCTLNSKVISSKVHKNVQGNSGHHAVNNGGNDSADRRGLSNENKKTAITATILPPPLFDEEERRDIPRTGMNEIIKTPSSLRRYHRTIPRHFTAVDPLLVNVKTTDGSNSSQSGNTGGQSGTANKKPICQCPVQHVPMTYMGTNHFNPPQGNPSNVFLSTLTTKLVNNKTTLVPKSASLSASSRMPAILKQNHDTPSLTKVEQNTISGTLRRSNHHHTSSSFGQNSSNKIATISKHVGELRHDLNTNHGHVQSILKTPTPKDKICHNSSQNTQHNVLKTATEAMHTPFPIHFIEGMSKVPPNLAQNPVLPPKLYKNYSMKQTSNPLFVSKIHTISKPNEQHQIMPRTASIPRSGYAHPMNTSLGLSASTQTKSLPRKEEKVTPTLTLPSSGGLLGTERSQSLGKINSATFYPIQSNNATYTLPKQTNGKISLNSTIASVVSKVPSVISIPSPSTNTNEISYIQGTNINLEHLPFPLTTNQLKIDTIPSVLEFKPSPTEDKKSSTLKKINNGTIKSEEKPLPVCTTSKNCSNPKEHFLPNDTSLDDDYLSECENCKTAHSSRYYLDEEAEDAPQETMTLQRKMDDKEEEQTYYRASLTLPTNTKKNTTIKNNRETWFSSIPASSSSDEEQNE